MVVCEEPAVLESTRSRNPTSFTMSGECQTKNTKDYSKDDDKPIVALDEGLFLCVNDENVSILEKITSCFIDFSFPFTLKFEKVILNF